MTNRNPDPSPASERAAETRTEPQLPRMPNEVVQPLARLRVMFGGAPAPALVHADDVLAILTPDQPKETP